MEKLIISLGRIVPKARPRFNKETGAFLPQRYRAWKNQAIARIHCQKPPDWQPMDSCRITIVFVGKHNKNGDLDNLAGAVLDALVSAEVIIDDRLSVVRELSLRFEESKDEATTEIEVIALPKKKTKKANQQLTLLPD